MRKSKPDRWPALCELVREDDGLATRDIGEWTERKLWWWNKYIEITTRAMVDHPLFSGGLVYVDLFAGPAVLKKKDGTRIPGSPLLAAEAPKSFTKIILCEKDESVAAACEQRLIRFSHADRCVVIRGDCNVMVDDICREIPPNSLTLAFVDPTGLHANFETIEKLARDRAVDFLILVADGYDIVRNVEQYAGQRYSNLDAFLGEGCDWRSSWRQLPNHDSVNVCRMFLDLYQQQLKSRLGYSHFRAEYLAMPKGAELYRILFASRHELGLKFWLESTKHDKNSRSLF